jgi:hypothetical protein
MLKREEVTSECLRIGDFQVLALTLELNKQGGPSHGKVTRCLESLFGIRLSRGGSVHTVLRAAGRCEPVYESIRLMLAQSTGWCPMRPAGE